MKNKLIILTLTVFLVGCSTHETELKSIELDNEQSSVIKERIDSNIVETLPIKEILDKIVFDRGYTQVTTELGDKADNRQLVKLNLQLERVKGFLENGYTDYKSTFIRGSEIVGMGGLDEENEDNNYEDPQFEEGVRYLEYHEWLKGVIKSDIYFDVETGNTHIIYTITDSMNNLVINVEIQGGKVHEVQTI